jgi:hypothetical protein
MNTQDLTIPGVNPFTFAGFQWPRHIARRLCSEYYHAPLPETASTGRKFYLGSVGQPFSRWQWCDEVDRARIDHTGWFCDEMGVDKIRGIVVTLPHGRFLAGCSMGEGKASTVAADLYNTAEAAARAADRMAESAAEDEREHQAQQIEEMENLK